MISFCRAARTAANPTGWLRYGRWSAWPEGGAVLPAGSRLTGFQRTGSPQARLLVAGLLAGLLAGPSVGCAPERTTEATLDQLAQSPAAFDGARVRTRGVVHAIDDPEHYWIETQPGNRLGIRPGSAVAGWLGVEVVVAGRFSWHPERGRRLDVDTVTAGP